MYNKDYYQKHREKIIQYQLKYSQKHKKRISKYQKEYKKKNKKRLQLKKEQRQKELEQIFWEAHNKRLNKPNKNETSKRPHKTRL